MNSNLRSLPSSTPSTWSIPYTPTVVTLWIRQVRCRVQICCISLLPTIYRTGKIEMKSVLRKLLRRRRRLQRFIVLHILFWFCSRPRRVLIFHIGDNVKSKMSHSILSINQKTIYREKFKLFSTIFLWT